jgi:DNA primase
MDVIAAHQYGFRNVVASMGTSLTDKQAALLRRFGSTIVLAMDADEAGNAATLRGVQVVAATASRPGSRTEQVRPLDVRVAALPKGIDPDEMVRKDPESWRALIAASVPMMEHLYSVHTANRDMHNPADREAAIAELLPVIAEIPGPVEQAHWVSRLGGGRVGEETLWRQIRGLRGRKPATSGDEPTVRPTGQRSTGEEFCLALLHSLPSLAKQGAELDDDLFGLSENRELFRRWQSGDPVGEDEDVLWEHLQRILQVRLPAYETAAAEAALLDCVRRLQQGRIKAAKEASALALAEGVAGVRPGQVASIARARWEAGSAQEADGDATELEVASMFLDDMETGLRLHRDLIERSRPDQPDTR